MFTKKKSVPSFPHGNGNSRPASGRNEHQPTGSGPSSSRRPINPQELDLDIPTLQPSPIEDSLLTPSANRNSRHGRSASHPFPVLLGGMGIRREGNRSDRAGPPESATGRPSQASKGLLSSSLPKSGPKSQASPVVDGDLVTGKCATCDSPVRWPRHVDVFRCSVCHMVNDLQYGNVKESAANPNGKAGAIRLPSKAVPISLERTRSLVNQGTHVFLKHKLSQCLGPEAKMAHNLDKLYVSSPDKKKNKSDSTEDRPRAPRPGPPTLELPLSAPWSENSDAARQSRSPGRDPQRAQRPPGGSSRSRPATGKPRPSLDGAEDPDSKYIYRQLENYLISCLADCDCLNLSFAIGRPPGPARGISDSAAPGSHHHTPRQQEHSDSNDGFLAELDARMLWMGDIGENARFWTGGGPEGFDGQHASAGPNTPGHDRRQPKFNWRQIWQWYQSLLYCGRQWRVMRSSFTEEDKHYLERPEVEREIDASLAGARYHVQRTLLKATEKLLTHPGRLIRRPEDARFLLILLSNPLFHPRQSYHGSESSADGQHATKTSPGPLEQSHLTSPRARSTEEAANRGNATGHHSGIIRRILGMLGNLPNDTHQVMISWLSRMPEPQLRDLVELVSGFMSYRLTRNAGRARASSLDPTNGLIPVLTGPSSGSIAQLHAAVATTADSSNPSAHQTNKTKGGKVVENSYADDWQVRTAAKFMSLLFFANFGNNRIRQQLSDEPSTRQKEHGYRHGQVLPVSSFYNALLDEANITADFDQWELKRNKFSFCQYPMFLSIWSKIRLMEYDARRQMTARARNAFFDTIMRGKNTNSHFILHVRRDCVVEDSLNEISHVVGSEEIKKGLKIEFAGEEGIDVGGLRKEWFLLLVREVFDPRNGLFIYDEDSKFCYFNPHTFETSDQFYLIGVVLGLAIYNSTILDITLPPFLFRKLLASAPPWTGPSISAPKAQMTYTLDDLAEWRPNLARGLRQLLEYDGDVEATFCRDFVVDVERYGTVIQVPLCVDGENRAVNNGNRKEFVDLYVRYVLDTSVSRQFEPFKRGFFTVCSGTALALFRPEEIELLVRGSDEPLDVDSLQSVAIYDGWGKTPGMYPQVHWFWQTFKDADPKDQRRLLGFITGSDRIPAMGATSLVIKVGHLGEDARRFPIARTCFNMISLYDYPSKEQLEHKLWMAVGWSEGFGLK